MIEASAAAVHDAAVLLLVLLLSPPPAVTAGPELALRAEALAMPIEHVTVFSDRARVERKGKASSKSGVRVLRLPDLPGSTLLDTVRVGAAGASVLRVEVTPVKEDRGAIDEVRAVLDKGEALRTKQAALVARRGVLAAELAKLQALRPAGTLAEQHRVGKKGARASLEGWRQGLDFVARRSAELNSMLRELDGQAQALDEALTSVALLLREVRGFSERRVRVVAIVDSRGAPSLSLQYMVPGPSWTPGYEVELAPKGKSVTLRTAAVVRQSTGEDWENVKLSLSTAIPGRGIALPELLTWTLGERKEFRPQAQERRRRAPGRLAPPVPRATLSEQQAAEALAELQQRISGFEGGATNRGKRPEVTTARRRISESGGRRAPPPRPARMPSPPPPAPSMAMEGDAMDDDGASFGVSLGADVGERRRSQRTSMSLFDNASTPRQRFSDRSLPAVIAGGLDYVYPATTRVTVPSSTQSHEVPLAADRYPISSHYEAAPALRKTAYLRAAVKNTSGRPLLGGPVQIFAGTDFLGAGRLDTTGPGGEIELPLGADEDVRLIRKVVLETVTEGVFATDEVTTYKVTIEVGNYKRRALKIRVFDQLPVSAHEEVKIKRGKLSPAPVEGPDATGMLRFDLEIPAGKTKTIRFAYTITRPENWQLTQ